MIYYIGIDGGGTKTAFVLADEAGRRLGACTLGGSSHRQIGVDGVAAVVREGMDRVFREAGIDPEEAAGRTAVCFGMPNYGESTYYDGEMEKRMRLEFPRRRVWLVNDAQVGWAGSLLLEEGINIVAGTGSIAYGQNREGAAKTAGGWNEWFSDEGSCKWLGIKCMELFGKEADGRLERGPLYGLVREYFSLEKDIDVIDIFERDYQPYRDKTASLQRLLMEAALAGDLAALRAYEAAARELADILKAIYRGLAFQGRCPVSYSGGLFHSGELILRPLREELKEYPMELTQPKSTPVLGAVLLAKQFYDGRKPEERFVKKIVESKRCLKGEEGMFLTETEIMTQHEALKKTYAYMREKKGAIQEFFRNNSGRKFLFLGCGSSYMLAKSAERLFGTCPETTAYAVAGGDYLVNPDYFANLVKDSIVVVLSRSGQTTEIVRAVKQIHETGGNPVVSLSMKADNDVDPFAALSLTFDWCYDRSVCQTRTVTNLYTAILLLCSIYRGDEELDQAVLQAVNGNEAYKEKYRPVLEKIAAMDWDNAIVLADGALGGLGEEGALAFTEIAMLPGKCFQLLDYRHGPIVLNDKKTLTIAVLQPGESELQGAMVEDLKSHGGAVVTVSSREENLYGADAHICVGDVERYEAYGIPFIYVMQMTAYAKSLLLGRNPDAPAGLDAFITF